MKVIVHENIFLRTKIIPDSRADIWCIHGFAESGLSFREIFESSLVEHFNILVPDFPGFGVSPLNGPAPTIESSVDQILRWIQFFSPNKKLIVLGHSLGGLIGTSVCEKLSDQISLYVNIEGNLTRSDTFYSGITTQYTSPTEFYSFFEKEIFNKLSGSISLQRYYASLRFADPRALLSWGKSCYEATGQEDGGKAFKKLTCQKIYYWGDQSTPLETADFIRKYNLPNRCFKGSGHWPMIDEPRFYEILAKDIQGNLA